MEPQDTQTAPIAQLPPIPTFSLSPPQIKQHSYTLWSQRKHLMIINGQQQFNNTKQEVQKKLKKVFQRLDQTAKQQQSTGQGQTIDITTLAHCQRCDRWINKYQMGVHMSCHAAIITDNLLLGDKFCAQSKKQLIQRMKVTHVVNAAFQLDNYLEKQGIKYKNLQLYDDLEQSLIQPIKQAVQFINQAHRNKGIVFVHCAVGKSRSVSIILLYLMIHKGMTIDQALKLVKQKRPVAQPNFNYMKQLLQYEKTYLQMEIKQAEARKQKQQSTSQNKEIQNNTLLTNKGSQQNTKQ